MQLDFKYGRQHVALTAADNNVVPLANPDINENLTDPEQAIRDVLETPLDFPTLRRALTPDDRIVVVVDESIPQLARFLTPVLQHILSAHVKPEAITLLCPDPSTSQPWLDDLPDDFLDVRVEVHDAGDRDKLSYLATTQKGRRIYMNRTLVDADQVVVFTRRGHDPLRGYTGGETDLFPALCDDETRKALCKPKRSVKVGKEKKHYEEAGEVAWMIGLPFFVQVISGQDDGLAHVVGGTLESSAEGLRLWQERWQVQVSELADVVIASLGEVADADSFAEMARALMNAANVVQPDGKIVLLTDANPDIREVLPYFQEFEEVGEMLERLAQADIAERESLYLWANAAARANLYLLSHLSEETTEDLWATALQKPEQVQKLVTEDRTCLFLPEANKMYAGLMGDKVRG